MTARSSSSELKHLPARHDAELQVFYCQSEREYRFRAEVHNAEMGIPLSDRSMV